MSGEETETSSTQEERINKRTPDKVKREEEAAQMVVENKSAGTGKVRQMGEQSRPATGC